MYYLGPAFIAAFGWGVMPLIDRFNLKHINSITLLGYKAFVFMIFGIIILYYGIYNNKLNLQKGYKTGGKKLILGIIATTFFAYILGQFGFYKSIEMSPKSILTITLISYCLPVIIVAILSKILYGDAINFMMYVGIFITLVGISVTVLFNPNYIKQAV